MAAVGFPNEVIEGIKDSIDCNIYFFGEKVGIGAMYIIMAVSVVLLVAVYIAINMLRQKRR